MIVCTSFNCIPCMQKTAPAQKQSFNKLFPDTVRDAIFYVLCLGPHFCYPIPSFDNSTGDGWGLITLQEVPHLNFAWPQYQRTEVSTDQEIALPKTTCKVYG